MSRIRYLWRSFAAASAVCCISLVLDIIPPTAPLRLTVTLQVASPPAVAHLFFVVDKAASSRLVHNKKFAERRKDKFNGQPGGAIRMVEYRIDLCDIQRGHFARVGN